MQKRCPRCQAAASTDAAACGQCGRFYQTTAPRPPAPSYAPPVSSPPAYPPQAPPPYYPPQEAPLLTQPWFTPGWFVFGLVFGWIAILYATVVFSYGQRWNEEPRGVLFPQPNTYAKRVSLLAGGVLGTIPFVLWSVFTSGP